MGYTQQVYRQITSLGSILQALFPAVLVSQRISRQTNCYLAFVVRHISFNHHRSQALVWAIQQPQHIALLKSF